MFSVSWLTHSLSEKTRVVFLQFVNNTDSACLAAKCVVFEFVSTFTFTFELHKDGDSFTELFTRQSQKVFSHFIQNQNTFHSKSKSSQYLVCPPRVAMQALILLRIPRTKFPWNACGISFQMLTRATWSCWRFCGGFSRSLSLLFISSQTCSIGFISGELAGHLGRTRMCCSRWDMR